MLPEKHASALLSVAEQLARPKQKSSTMRQAELRRAISTAYYALFHAIRVDYADFLVGRTVTARNSLAWSTAFRTLNHGPLANASQKFKNAESIGSETKEFFNPFADLKQKRERADYDAEGDFGEIEVLNALAQARSALNNYKSLPTSQRRQALALVLSGTARKQQ